MKRLTPWFSAMNQPPVRMGWYLCRNAKSDRFDLMRYWDGAYWLRQGPRTSRVKFGFWNPLNQWRGRLSE